MAFKSWNSYWDFAKKVTHHQRYIHDTELVEFLYEVEKTSLNRIKTIPQGKHFYRAQLGEDWSLVECEGQINEHPAPHKPSRMLPRPHRANEGRVNPKGIPHLYMATDPDTAMAEIRPWVGASVSLATLDTTRDLRVIDCSLFHTSRPIWYFEEPEEDKREQIVWGMIDRAFSNPITSSDDTAAYAPTQIISEMFKSKGFDGIVYKSMLGDGHNIATFGTGSAKLIKCALYEAKSIKFEFSECANPYYIK